MILRVYQKVVLVCELRSVDLVPKRVSRYLQEAGFSQYDLLFCFLHHLNFLLIFLSLRWSLIVEILLLELVLLHICNDHRTFFFG